MLLRWDKPEKIMSVEAWKDLSADSAPPGVYMPNMSQADAESWKAKLVGHKVGRPHVEIRKTVRGVQLFLIVSQGKGYKYKYYVPDIHADDQHTGTIGINIHISTNGALQMTFVEFDAMKQVINEATTVLAKLEDPDYLSKDWDPKPLRRKK
jgi:hypothetical protein